MAEAMVRAERRGWAAGAVAGGGWAAGAAAGGGAYLGWRGGRQTHLLHGVRMAALDRLKMIEEGAIKVAEESRAAHEGNMLLRGRT